jgi:hypothetical protein
MRRIALVVAVLAGCTGSAIPIGGGNQSVSCTDGVKNGNETDVDCGGVCSPCAAGKGCLIDADCASAACVGNLCCAAGTADCNGNPADGCEATLATDPHNCGRCGVACGTNISCVAGECTGPCACSLPHATGTCANGGCAIASCDPGFADCDGVASNGCETNIATNVNNCGLCNNACMLPNAQADCAKGTCAVAACQVPFADCNGAASDGCEANLQSDAANCGACGQACGGAPNAGAACSAGACTFVCDSGFGDCDRNAANGCETDLTSDPVNCGACGNSCAQANAPGTCMNGVCHCVLSCSPGFLDCDGNCANGCETNAATDPNNCGACGNVCRLPNATPTCTAGACAINICIAGFGDCDFNAANGCETNLAFDPKNCGACGVACAPGIACVNGVCTGACTDGIKDGQETDVDCGGPVCPACSVGKACLVGADCTSHLCNAGVCAACANACVLPNATAQCLNGACSLVACDAGFADCNALAADGCETHVNSDVNNCGGCGMACSTNHIAPACSAGSCEVGVCTPGYADCNNNRRLDGCEVDLNSDSANCGFCGNVCPVGTTCQGGMCSAAITCGNCTLPNATSKCVNNTCVIASCNQGYADCDGLAVDGCETDLLTDVNNCGGCANRCSTPNGAASCVAGVCGCILSCAQGYADCDHNCANGCETNLANDVNNCGACGFVCPAGGTCVNGFCSSCGNTTVACGNTCVDTNTNPSNCGGCGMACSNNNIAQPTCANGLCNGACNAGFADCNNNKLRDGCEANLSNDANNCGACGAACAAGQICSTGKCIPAPCQQFYTMCNGVCVNLMTDNNNCGFCGTVCTQFAPCYAGACGGDCGGPPRIFCANVNTCTDPAVDPNNCGACGTVCSANNGVAACTNGACTINCNVGYADCDKNALNGCETNLLSDNANCGACGVACVNGAMCYSGACGLCNAPGYFACVPHVCISLLTDINNCGACNNVCALNHAQSSCANGVCGIAICNVGFADCDNLAANGCETSVANDPNNCGACGKACAAGHACVNGLCQ